MTAEPRTLIEMLQVAARKDNGPLYRFLTDGNPDGNCERLSARDLEADAERIGAALAESAAKDASERPRIAIALESPLDFARAFFGCLYADAVAVPVDPPPARPNDARLELLRSILSDARPSLVIADSANRDGVGMAVKPGSDACTRVCTIDELLKHESGRKPSPVSPHDLALLQYTSGSTSSPRGVMIRHENLLANLKSIQAASQPPADALGVCWLPLSHDMGLVGNFLLNLYAGGELVLMTPRALIESPLQWLRAISRFRAWGTCAPNFAFELCNRAIRKADAEQLDLSSLDAVLCGAEPIDPETLERFLHRFEPQGFRRAALRPCYGLAEATLLVSVARRGGLSAKCFESTALRAGRLREAPSSAAGRRVVSCGEIQPGLDAVVVDPATRRRLNDGEVGEIWVSGKSVAAGYFGWPKAHSDEIFRAEIECDTRRYLRTGDLGAFHDGELFLTGRIKDQVIVGGRNHDAHDLERIATGAHPGFQRGKIAVVADFEKGERVLVILEPPPRMKDAEFPALAQAIRRNLAGQAAIQPDAVLVVPPKSIASTSSGKMRRAETLRLLRTGVIVPLFADHFRGVLPAPSTGADAADREELLRAALVREVRFAARLGERDPVAWTARLSELGIDSLGLVQLTTCLRDVTGREVSPEISDNDPTLSEILERLRDPAAYRSERDRGSLGANGAGKHRRSSKPIARAASDLRERHALRDAVFHDVFEPARRFGLLAAAHEPEHMPFYRAFSDWEGTHAHLDGRRVLILSSFDYLGLANDDRVKQAARRAAEEFGTGRSGARIHAGTTPEILALEQKIARFTGRGDALICTTGYQAMIAVATTFMNSRTTLVADEAAHASILDGAAISRCRLVRFRHNDREDLDTALRQAGPAMVVVEGLYSNHGDVPPLPEIRECCNRHGARLVLDDAHGLGTLGASGRGTEEHFGCVGACDIVAGTFSKSLCSIGGWIAGDREVINYVRYHGRSVLFTAAISPPMAAAADAALDILIAQPERAAWARRNAEWLRQCLREQGVPVTGEHGPLLRIPVGEELTCVRLASEMLRRDIFVQPVLYPSVPRDEAMIRLCVSAAHDADELRRAAGEFASTYHPLVGPRRRELRASAGSS